MLDLLRKRNFTEQTLGLHARRGMIDRKIQQAVALAVEASLEKNTQQNILFEIKAHPGLSPDEVKFTFRFDYNHEQQTLRLHELTASLNERDVRVRELPINVAEARKLFIYSDSRQLVDAHDAYQLLTTIRAQKQQEQTFLLQAPKIRQHAHRL